MGLQSTSLLTLLCNTLKNNTKSTRPAVLDPTKTTGSTKPAVYHPTYTTEPNKLNK